MHKLKKSVLVAAGLALVAASSLLVKPVRVWASAEGSYIYNQFIGQGPTYLFKSRVGLGQGLYVSTGTYKGDNPPTAPAGAPFFNFAGSYTTAGRPACAAGTSGLFYYDTTVNSIAFCDGTTYHKLVTGVAANDSWTSF